MIGWQRLEVARNIARDIPDGSIVNLGIGLPEAVAEVIPPDREVLFHTENGLLGMGPAPTPDLGDPELVNAGKRQVTAVAGAAYFHHSDSFAMIRGGHIDICVLGAMQVSLGGDLANWSTGADDLTPAVGGAMDLVAGVRTIFIATTHCTKDGAPKLVRACTYPLTGRGVVTRIYTNLAVLDIGRTSFEVVRLAAGVSLKYVQEHTDGAVTLSSSFERDENDVSSQFI
jgi:3-oxoadipate CoA-transferase beta subunit